MKRKIVFSLWAGIPGLVGLLLAAPAGAQTEAGNSLALEEVIVTAQKREQGLQDVPIAISAVAGEFVRDKNINNLQELSSLEPSLYVAESFVGDSIYIRGLGSGQNNLGFEQAVGRVVDGYFYGRSRFSRISFLDLERIEVLKGPQGALIGKNTTAGALNITTARPTKAFSGYITPTYEFEGAQGYSVEGAVSGSLSSVLRGRIAIKRVDRDGFIKNISTGKDDISKEETLGRLSLAWEAAENVEMLFQYQYGDIDHEGGNNQYSKCVAPLSFIFAGISGDDCTANYHRTGTATKNGTNVEGKETNFDTYALTVDWDLGGHTITSLTGFAKYDYRDLQDGDRSRLESTLPEFAEDYEQWTQELRLTSAQGEKHDYLFGLFFMGKEQDTDYTVHFNVPAANAVQSRNTFTSEKSTTYAFFGQWTSHLSEQWDLTIGGRYTYEDKKAHSVQYGSELYTTVADPDCMSFIPGVCSTHDIRDKFDEDDFSPELSVQWRPNDDAMYYASVRRGFKAGGYDHNLVADDSDADIMDRFQFDSEDVTAFELGAKLKLANGASRLNIALFRSEFGDLQLGGFLDSTSAINTVTNAASATSQGAEASLTWRVTEALTLFGSIAYIDSTYDDYKDAPCYTLQTTGCGNGRQDLSGEKLQFTSDWKGSASLEYVWRMDNGLELVSYLQGYFVDDFPLQADLDPSLYQDSYLKADASLTLTNATQSWALSLICRNLADKLSSNYGDDVPAQAGTVWRSVDAPRSIALQGTWNF
jgi:outer membrane receptor protein involved in Fe transport